MTSERSSHALRRARGVYYTPSWLVDDMIQQALSVAREAFPDQRLTVLDPACGDGAFLRRLPPTVRSYGVDIEADALVKARAHCDADLVCGDAIVDRPGVTQAMPLVWHERFPSVFAQGGFHTIVGNPPYRNMDQAQEGDEPSEFARLKRYLKQAESADPRWMSWGRYYRRMADLYHLFFFRAMWALRPGGVLAFVTSRTWLEAWYADRLRERLLAEMTVLEIRDYGDQVLFEGTQIPAAVIVAVKSPAPPGHRICVNVDGETRPVLQSSLGSTPWRFRASTVEGGVPLGELCELSQGMQTGCNSVFADLTDQDVHRLGLEPAGLRRRVVGSDIRPGALAARRQRWAVWTEDCTEAMLLPNIRRWLESHRERLEARAAFRRGDCAWYQWSWPRPSQVDRPKILCPYRAAVNRFWFDRDGSTVGLTDTTVLLPRTGTGVTPEQLVGLLNDPVHTERQHQRAKRTGQGLYEYFARQLSELPIKL